MKALYGKNKLASKNWRDTIERTVILVGQAQNSNDLAFCFLKNMIAIEMLLTDANDKYSTILPERIEAFIGWVGYWQTDDYKKRIEALYIKRCKLVHDGNTSNIKPEDILFSDDLIFNILHNIIRNIRLFPTKDSLIKYSDKVKAEKLLGIKSKVQPKTLEHFNRQYEESDYQKILKNFS